MSFMNSNKLYALADVNNFYVSCERLFRPDLEGKAVIVLSNNDGCIISRSNEAKQIGLRMGEPFFKVRDLCKAHQVEVFSSNYTLYGDMSARVMQTLSQHAPAMEIYSIDEAFMQFAGIANPENLANNIQARVLRDLGMPISIGMGPTKTLAKLANFIAKKRLDTRVFNLANPELRQAWLPRVAVAEVWGIGQRTADKLKAIGIRSAYDLAMHNPMRLRKLFNINVAKTAQELAGINCLELEKRRAKKSIVVSRSFGTTINDRRDLQAPLCQFVRRACSKLRAQKSVAISIAVFAHSQQLYPPRRDMLSTTLARPSSDFTELLRYATLCLDKIFIPGSNYKKIGIMIMELEPEVASQQDLFIPTQHKQDSKLMDIVDAIDHRYGRDSIKLGSELQNQKWQTAAQRRSPSYTTSWLQLRKIK